MKFSDRIIGESVEQGSRDYCSGENSEGLRFCKTSLIVLGLDSPLCATVFLYFGNAILCFQHFF